MKRKRNSILYIVTFLLISISMIIIFAGLRIYPFGNKSILLWDMKIQYVEYFSYLKEVFSGNADVIYSFSKSLGGSLVATFGYYLSSPLNLLVIFFDQENMESFLVIITVLKAGLCGVTCAVFLRKRFLFLSDEWNCVLACAFALSQYVISQMSNIMWLDGVYMLPVLMLGVYRFVRENKKGVLCIGVTLGIIFNWYTGYMNCLFLPLYFLYEQSIAVKNRKYIMKRFFVFCAAEGLAVLMSMFFFLPVILELRNGKGTIESNIFEFTVNGKFLDVFRGFVTGSQANSKEISLFCGTVCLVGAIAFFINSKIDKREKKLAGIMSLFLIMSCYLKPLENIWNGFRFVHSYFYRFSYIIIIFIIYLCARNLETNDGIEKRKWIKIIGGIVLGLLLLDEITAFNPKKLWIEITMLIIILAIIQMKNVIIGKRILGILLIGELIINGVLVCKHIYTYDSETYKEYVKKEKQLIEEVKQYNGEGFFRLEQTKNREMNPFKTTAYFAESMSFGYHGISHYNSGFDYKVHQFISDLGYSDSIDIAIYDEPILAADSLLGVNYLMAEHAYPGWERVSDIQGENGKEVYKNPYVLPAGIRVQKQNSNRIEQENPFLYQNQLYSEILGRKVELYKKLEVKPQCEERGISYYIPHTDREGIVYGYGRFSQGDLKVYINDEYRCDYQKWLSYLVMNIGEGSRDNKVFFQGTREENLRDEVEFYYLDMETFEKVINELKERGADNYVLTDGNASFKVTAQEGEELLTTIPYDEGWDAYVNGKKVQPKEAEGIFLSVPLKEGENKVVLKYHLQGVKAGVGLSGISIIIFAGWHFCGKRKRIKSKGRE